MREIPLQFDDNGLEKGTGREALARYPDPEHRQPFTEVSTMPVDGMYTESSGFCNREPFAYEGGTE